MPASTPESGRASVPESTRRSAQGWLLVLPALAYAALVWPFVDRGVLGEPDLERFAVGLMYGASTGLHTAAGFQYDLPVSFGYYAALYHLLPSSVLHSSSALIAAINAIGYGSAIVAVAALGLYAARIFGTAVGVAAALLFGLSPMFLELGASGHPELPGMALMLCGGWVLTFVAEAELARAWRVAAAAAALAITAAALCVRADLALMFPFMVVASREPELRSGRAWLRASGLRCAVLAAALGIFLGLQFHGFRGHGGNGAFVGTFFRTFFRPKTVPHGLEILVLCAGMATLLALAGLLLSSVRRRLRRIDVLALTLLALPSLLFWLPNARPGRHLIVPILAGALVLALLLTRRWPWPRAIAAVVVLLIANQALAEGTHGWMVRHYQWTYPPITARRATDTVPLGAFALDLRARQARAAVFRAEGRAFARACSGQVVVAAESDYDMLLSLIESDPAVRLTSFSDGDLSVLRASGRRCTADFVYKYAAARRDVVSEILASPRLRSWPIYFQDATRTRYDRTAIPAARRYELKGGWHASGGGG